MPRPRGSVARGDQIQSATPPVAKKIHTHTKKKNVKKKINKLLKFCLETRVDLLSLHGPRKLGPP